MRRMLVLFRHALRGVSLVALALAALSGCAGPLRLATTPEPIPTAQVLTGPTPAPTPLPEATPTAPAVNCTPTVVQPAPGEPITLLARVAGCPGLVRVEWGAAILIVPVERLGLQESDMVGLPEEVR